MGGGKRNQPTQQLPNYSTSSRLMNMFSVLEDSDTEEELELVPEDSTYSSEGEVDVGDGLHGLDGDGVDGDGEEDEKEKEKEQEKEQENEIDQDESIVTEEESSEATNSFPKFRTWKTDDDINRFSTVKHNIFSSPFSRKKTSQYSSKDKVNGNEKDREREKEREKEKEKEKDSEEDGWVSIQVGSTQHPDSQTDIPYQQSQQNINSYTFPSLLSRGKSVSSDTDILEEQNALAWAEKVKLTLERAGQSRSEIKRTAVKSEDSNNTISFFRRSIVLDEKF